VEIAYFTFPEHEGQGCATEMARQLTEMALQDPQVQRVIAHTLPEPNASTHVLEKNGFRFVGSTEDPEEGTIWRWEKT